LKQDLKDKLICTWNNTARQFLDGLQDTSLKKGERREYPQERGGAANQLASRSEFIMIPRPSWPDDLSKKGVEMPDSMLLRPECRVVRFHRFRERLRDAIVSWALGFDEPIKLRLQAGEGGTGKTRLLIEVCDQLERSFGWRAGFMDRSQSIASEFATLLREGK